MFFIFRYLLFILHVFIRLLSYLIIFLLNLLDLLLLDLLVLALPPAPSLSLYVRTGPSNPASLLFLPPNQSLKTPS